MEKHLQSCGEKGGENKRKELDRSLRDIYIFLFDNSRVCISFACWACKCIGASDINGPSNGKIETSYDYTFISTSPLGNDVYYYVDWGDEMNSGWIGPYSSGEVVTLSHAWRDGGGFTIKAKAKDTDNLWGPWGEFNVNMKVRNRAYSNTLFYRLLESFPLLEKILLFHFI